MRGREARTDGGWERLYGPSLAEGRNATLVTTIGNGKVSYELEGMVLTNAQGRSVFRTRGGCAALSALVFAAGEWGGFEGGGGKIACRGSTSY